MGKIASKLEEIIDIHKTFYAGEVRGADLAHNIELFILDAKPEKKREQQQDDVNYISGYEHNQALNQWTKNMETSDEDTGYR